MTTTPDGDPDHDLDLEGIRAVLEGHPVELGFVYGSRVEGEPFPWSDLDVAVQLDPEVEGAERGRVLDRLAAELEDATEAEAVDVADLEAMGPHRAYEAARTGILLVGEEADAVALEARTLLTKLDFDPVREAWREGLDERIEGGRYGRA